MQIKGVPVVDATKPLTVTITSQDIKKAANKDAFNCAAAMACKRQLHATEARVQLAVTLIKMPKTWVRYQTPQSLRSEIIAFDRGGTFAPGDYEFRPMRPSQKLGAFKPNDTRGPHTTKKRQRPHMVAGIRQAATGKNR